MKVIYEAKDGTQFDTEEECRDYERRHNALLYRYNFVAADASGKPISPAHNNSYNPDDFEYFACFTEEGLKSCEGLFQENGIYFEQFEHPIELNKVYYYDYNTEDWQPLSNRLNYLRSELDRLSTIENMVFSAKQS